MRHLHTSPCSQVLEAKVSQGCQVGHCINGICRSSQEDPMVRSSVDGDHWWLVHSTWNLARSLDLNYIFCRTVGYVHFLCWGRRNPNKCDPCIGRCFLCPTLQLWLGSKIIGPYFSFQSLPAVTHDQFWQQWKWSWQMMFLVKTIIWMGSFQYNYSPPSNAGLAGLVGPGKWATRTLQTHVS